MKDIKTIEYYNKNAANFIAGTRDADISEIRNKFINLLSPGSLILDAGCGSGRDTLFFINSGFEVTSIDASSEVCKLAEEYTKHPVICMSFDEIDSSDEFDGIWACASLLHIARESQTAIMEKLVHALKIGGILYASWKYGFEDHYVGERYYCDMNEQLILKTIPDNLNLKVLDLWVSSDVRACSKSQYWINMLLQKG